jgi:hypothetical protein
MTSVNSMVLLDPYSTHIPRRDTNSYRKILTIHKFFHRPLPFKAPSHKFQQFNVDMIQQLFHKCVLIPFIKNNF